MSVKDKIVLKGRIWLDIGNESFLGDGRIELLKQIEKKGSLLQAAKSMEMSYKKAWTSIRKMNEIADKTLVVLARGGKEGGSAILTDEALSILDKYDQLLLLFKNFLDDQNKSWENQS